jgi:hypothetical protein
MAVKKVTKVITPKETKIVKHEMETPIIIPDEIVAEEPIVEEVIETETLPELDTVELVEEEETAKPLDEVVEPETVETQPEVKQEDEVIEEVKPKSVLAQKLSEMKKESEEAAKNGSKQVKRPSYSEMFGHFWNGQNFS